MKRIFSWLTIIYISAFLVGCGSTPTRSPDGWVGYTESGKASFYANKHQGRKTASGDVYRHTFKTAAHKTLPFGTLVKVTNLDNDQSVIVKINDRGPFVRGRILDLSRSAFGSIAHVSRGVIGVEIEVIE